MNVLRKVCSAIKRQLFLAVKLAVSNRTYWSRMAAKCLMDSGLTPVFSAMVGRFSGQIPFILAFAANLVMAWVLAGMVGHMGSVTIRSAVISALFAWLGFVVTTMLVNTAFTGCRYKLLAIDAGHWLAVLVIMGIVIGWMGV